MSSLSHIAHIGSYQEHLLEQETNLKGYIFPIERNKTWIQKPFLVIVESETDFLDLNIE